MDEVKKAIESCRWRKDMGGVSVCLGMCTPCEVTIDKGNCEALIEYFEQMRKESK